MSQPRPDFIDLRSKSQASVSRPLRSPRLHVAGEAPPELSPLDAFAQQSRLLAKQLEDSAKLGRRMSRLPPLTVESPLIVQGRSEYFRSLSHDSASEDEHPPLQNVGLGLKTEIDEDHADRPRSMHPRLSHVPPTPDESIPVPAVPKTNVDPVKARQPSDAATDGSLFGANVHQEILQPDVLPLESTDEEGISNLSTSVHSLGSRKFSTSSSVLSPAYPPYQRSPSVASDASGLPRPQFNFSRPLSRAGTPSFDSPARQASSDSQGSFFPADDAATPISLTSETSRETAIDDDAAGAPSYIYSKFALPRGKALQRASVILLNDPPTRPSLDQPVSPTSNSPSFPGIGQPPPSPPTRPSSSSGNGQFDASRPSQDRSKLSTDMMRPAQQPSPNPSRPSTESTPGSEEEQRGRSLVSNMNDAAAGKSLASAATSDSASTIKGDKSVHSVAPAMSDLTAEEHVSKSIALHESGALQESTWHLRHAAKQGHPTDAVSLEINDEEGQTKNGKAADFAERKTRNAQFALSIYELGVSHMNGWGIEQDKTLALRCFEIAASWGDVDALAEAGFCYAQGIGCKKDLKKSAKFYREAEAKGMSMVGNSWIHKAKYDDDKDKQSRSKSRSRKSLFSRKKD
ncbi:hypothetical protein B0I37DRAFT_409998 [Chaetomium sp. MPI-CAGE-AT-0009]|nr:hypothetical protein B0I37DRAFT_409998 [Chaetomium sp. MPI-CAGE-AT-0009]